MDDNATSHSTSVGLMLNRGEELDLLRVAAVQCGLKPVDLVEELEGIDSGFSELSETQWRLPILAAMKRMELLVTDGEWEHIHDLDLSRTEPILTIRVQEETGPDKAGDWILHRPLRLEAVQSLLCQALRAHQVFAAKHRSLLEELHRARRIFASVCNGVTISDARAPDMPLLYVNPAFERMTGYAAHEVIGTNCRFLQGRETEQEGLTEIRRAIREGKEARALLKNFRKDGTSFWNEFYLSPIRDLSGNLTNFVGVQNDVTQQVESAQRLDYLATHDYLTGLSNRALMMTQLKHALLRAQRSGGNVAVLFFDLDKFKQVNDTFGHEAGDRLLQVVAARLRAETRGGEVVARLGGDEFVVVLEGFSGERPLPTVMQRLAAGISAPIDFLDHPFYPSASVGMALYPRDGDTAESLLKAADLNMYTAKHSARREEQNRQECDASRVQIT